MRALLRSWLVSVAAAFAAAGLTLPAAAGVLDDYVARPDDSYGWVERSRGEVLRTRYVELILTSQTWREIPWRHQLFVIKPRVPLKARGQHALLVIDGGGWRAEYDDRGAPTRLPDLARTVAGIANVMRTPVAILKQVPHQPLFGRSEDALIAYTFDQYMRTGDPDWPLLLPMTKAAVRGMDAVQEFAAAEWGIDVKSFTVFGASKRGWTTWLTGAVDPRVKAIAPMVIDIVNMPDQIDHQRAVWGELSHQISDYSELGLTEQLDTPRGRELLEIVDPYAYRERLTQPKLIINGTNDAYWPVDALNLYWRGFPGEKYIQYVPNAGHHPGSIGRIAGSINALHADAAGRFRMPNLTWHFMENGGKGLKIKVKTSKRPAYATLWVAASPTRDFRNARWRSARTSVPWQDGFRLPWQSGFKAPFQKSMTFDVTAPREGYRAAFVEYTYVRSTLAPFSLSTPIHIMGTNGRMVTTGTRIGSSR